MGINSGEGRKGRTESVVNGADRQFTDFYDPTRQEILADNLALFDTQTVASELKQTESSKKVTEQSGYIQMHENLSGVITETQANGSKIILIPNGEKTYRDGSIKMKFYTVVFEGWPPNRNLNFNATDIEQQRNVVIETAQSAFNECAAGISESDLLRGNRRDGRQNQIIDSIEYGTELTGVPGAGKTTITENFVHSDEAGLVEPEGVYTSIGGRLNRIEYELVVLETINHNPKQSMVGFKHRWAEGDNRENIDSVLAGYKFAPNQNIVGDSEGSIPAAYKLSQLDILRHYVDNTVRREYQVNFAYYKRLAGAFSRGIGYPQSLLYTGGMLQVFIFASAHMGLSYVPNELLNLLDNLHYRPIERVCIVPGYDDWQKQVLAAGDKKRVAILDTPYLGAIYADLARKKVIKLVDREEDSPKLQQYLKEVQFETTKPVIFTAIEDLAQTSWSLFIRSYLTVLDNQASGRVQYADPKEAEKAAAASANLLSFLFNGITIFEPRSGKQIPLDYKVVLESSSSLNWQLIRNIVKKMQDYTRRSIEKKLPLDPMTAVFAQAKIIGMEDKPDARLRGVLGRIPARLLSPDLEAEYIQLMQQTLISVFSEAKKQELVEIIQVDMEARFMVLSTLDEIAGIGLTAAMDSLDSYFANNRQRAVGLLAAKSAGSINLSPEFADALNSAIHADDEIIAISNRLYEELGSMQTPGVLDPEFAYSNTGDIQRVLAHITANSIAPNPYLVVLSKFILPAVIELKQRILKVD